MAQNVPMATATPLSTALAASIKAARKNAGWTQDHVARRMRELGASWDRTTVARVERGQRALQFDEAGLVAIALNVGIQALLPTKGDVALTPRLTMSANKVGLLYASDDAPRLPATAVLRDGAAGDLVAGLADTADDVARLLGKEPPAHLLLDAAEAEDGDAERKAAKLLGITPFEVAALALDTWGRSLTQERDHRLDERSTDEVSDGARNTMRGHITRELLAVLGRRLEPTRREE
jgi:transcriptional regulator with XRE-family HTH domain